MDLVIATAAQGVLWGLYALGVYLTYRVLDIADLTVEGSFPLGAAIAAEPKSTRLPSSQTIKYRLPSYA